MAKEKADAAADSTAAPHGKEGKGPPAEGGAKGKGAKEPRKAKGDAEASAAAPEAEPKADKPKAKAKPAKSEGAASAAGREESSKKQRGRSMRGQGKKIKAALAKRPETPVTIEQAVKLLREMGGQRKFDQTINVVLHLGIDPKQADQMIRGAVSLPKGIGKTRKVICFAEGEDADKAKAAGAAEVGSDELINKVNGGWADFDVAIAHPRLMGKVGKLGRVLGPLGKMPSPKNGTVAPDVAQAVKEFAAGKVEFRNDAGGNVHGIVGKLSFSDADLRTNIEAFIEHIRRLRPQTAKGHYIKKVCMSGTMTPSIELQVAQ